MKIVEVNGVTKLYGTKKALDNVSFSIEKQEIFGILGHNGAGKSTLIEIMLGLKNLQHGTVKVLNHDMSHRNRALFENIGVQLQHSAYQGKIRVKEVCQERAVLYQEDADYQKLLKDFSLHDKQNQEVDSLSGGEKQKLSIILAIMHEPDLIFLDELTTGLDVVARREIWNYLLALKQSGKSIVLSSHYMDEVEKLCDHVLILKNGNILTYGTVEEVIQKTPYKTMEEAYLWYMKEDELI